MSDTADNQNATPPSGKPEKTYWLDDMRNVNKIFWALIIVCALLFLSDAVIHRHSVFAFESIFGFFGLYGFCLSFVLVLTSREMRKFLMRDEDYYDRDH